MAEEIPELTVADTATWRDWLEHHHAEPSGVWLVLAKKGAAAPTTLTYAQALDEALCYGWIDGQIRSRDATIYLQRFTPRRQRSPWSQRNVDIVARLEAEGRMQPSGRAEVARAQADGRWQAAYAGPATMEVPEDLTAALAANPTARARFELLTSRNRYAMLYQLNSAKLPETRVRRIEQFIGMLVRGETLYPQKRILDDSETPNAR